MRLRIMNRRRWRKTQPFWVTQGKQAQRTHWHIWKLHNVWAAQRKRHQEAESAR